MFQIKNAEVHRNISYYGDLYWNNLVLLEVEPKFKFREHVREICLDWDRYYDGSDFIDGNEAVVSISYDTAIMKHPPEVQQRE